MTISTNDCKDFIKSISSFIGGDSKDKWKRTRKYKDGDLVLRDFENQDGRMLTISENGGSLSLFKLEAPNVSDESSLGSQGEMSLRRNAKDEDILRFISECVKIAPEIVYEDENTLEDAVNPTSWEILAEEDKFLTPEDWVDGWGGGDEDEAFPVYFGDSKGERFYLNIDDIYRVYMVWMPNYDTAYRIAIYETMNHKLFLGLNEPD